MNLYELTSFEEYIENIAAQNEGEIPEELFQKLVEEQTKSLQSIENLCKYTRTLQLGIEMCKAEESRIKVMRDRADKRIESIKKYLTPYIVQQGKIQAGTFTLSTRKSERVNLISESAIDEKYKEYVTTCKIDKNVIKKDLKAGIEVKGAELQQFDNLQIK